MKRYSLMLLAVAMLAVGCGPENQENPGDGEAVETYKFKDKVSTNAEAPENLDELSFLDTEGNEIRLSDYRGKKNVVLVFTRGFSGILCPLCATQTSRLISNYPEIQQRGSEVLLVYPGKERLDEFIAAAQKAESQVDSVPFPIVLDPDLAAVKFFDIVDELALPSTYILDKEGRVRFAYVGKDPSDRPSIKALLAQLDNLST